jgi:hypothetical protein
MHAVGRNGANNEIGWQNDDACGKIPKIQATVRLTSPPKSSNIAAESFGPPTKVQSEPRATGERSGILFTPHRERA